MVASSPKTVRRAGTSGEGAVPMHLHVRQTLASDIARGVYSVGDMIPSEAELCRIFDVSRITVRQALASLVNDGLLIKQPGRGTFVSSSQAKPDPSSSGKNKVIGLVLTNALGTFMSQLILGVEKVVREHGYSLHIAIAHDDPAKERACIDELIANRVAGALLLPVDSEGQSNPNCFDYLRIQRAGIPLLFVDRHLSQLPVGYVVGPDEQGMTQLTNHLIAQGHDEIGYIHHNISASSVVDRQKGYMAALLANRLHPGPILTVNPPRNERSDVLRGYEVVRQFLATGQRAPRALIGCNSSFAIGAIRALTEAGLRVPEDVAVAGFDDLPECEVLSVPLTVMRVPIEGMGARAAELLIHRIERGPAIAELEQEKLPGELVVRESCGADQRVTA